MEEGGEELLEGSGGESSIFTWRGQKQRRSHTCRFLKPTSETSISRGGGGLFVWSHLMFL